MINVFIEKKKHTELPEQDTKISLRVKVLYHILPQNPLGLILKNYELFTFLIKCLPEVTAGGNPGQSHGKTRYCS